MADKTGWGKGCIPHLKLLILLLLARDGPLCPCIISRRLEELGFKGVGEAVYTILRRMAAEGLVRARKERLNGRLVTLYSVTDKGLREAEKTFERVVKLCRVLGLLKASNPEASRAV